jgi:hypothetical protein
VLNEWESLYPPEQIFIGFNDQMKETPGELLQSLYEFFGVETS